MSSTSGKIMSPTSHVKHNPILGRAQSGSGSQMRSSLPVTNYSICHMKSPMVHCVKLNIPNGNSYKTDVERENKTDPCVTNSASVTTNDNSENATLPSSDKTSGNVNANMNTSEDQTTIIPDSTTNQIETKQAFNCGDDVFVQQKDGRYYLGTVIKTESGGGRWLVRFGDNTERWAVLSELRPLSSSGGADAPAMCVVCKLSGNGRLEDVIACDKCSRGYHPSCHSPPVTSSIKGAQWHCRRCVDQRFKVAAAENRALRKAEMSTIKQNHKPLPYDLKSLHWDSQHRTNDEKTYCYCGEPGDWFAQMLQCARCRQWFHQNCILCLKYPLYTGDRFYMFVCSLCNFGSEFLRRIEMKWVDLVHLMLFNLTMFHSKKYFDLDTTVIPYTASNWYALQLPLKMQTSTPSERREHILSALSNNGNRFKCGREIKKRTTIWGLRKRAPPPPPSTPTAPLPRGPITDQTLANRWGRQRLTFVSQPHDHHSHNSGDLRQRMIVPPDNHWQSLMMGKQFQSCSGSDAESQRSTPSPMLLSDIPSGYQPSNDFNMKSNFILNKKYKEEVIDSDGSNDDLPLVDIKPVKQKEYKFYEMDYQCGGFVKKSVPFPKSVPSKRGNAEKKDIFSKQRIKKRRETFSCRDFKGLDEDDDDDNSKAMNKSKKKFRKSLARQEKNNLRTASTGSNTLHMHEDSSHRLLGNDISKDGSSTYGSSLRLNEVVLPPTPPTSMSAPPTPPAISGPSSYSNLSDMSCDYQGSQSISKKVDCSYDSDIDLADFKEDKCEKLHERKLKLKENSPVKIEKSQSDDESAKLNLMLDTSKTFTHKSATMNLEISKLSTKNIIEHSKIMSLHHMKSDDMYSIYSHNKLENDSSGDDTSSRGTLDSIIPPPVNFQGANNPFHSVNNAIDQNKNTLFGNIGIKGNSLTNKLFNRNKQCGSATKKRQRISLPASLNPVIQPGVKLLKRQLSEKDLIIGPNGEVKRRRHRRTKASMNNQNNLSGNKDTSLNERQKSLRSSLCQEEPTKNSTAAEVIQQISARLDTSAKSRCLRQRQEKNYCDGRRGSTSSNNGISTLVRISNIVTPVAQSVSNINPGSSGVRSLNLSPQKNDQWNVPDDIQDLKSSVHSYFGAPNRIAAGEKFTLAGKRLTESGKLQYLIEWEGHGS